jgi:hypothetical protein
MRQAEVCGISLPERREPRQQSVCRANQRARSRSARVGAGIEERPSEQRSGGSVLRPVLETTEFDRGVTASRPGVREGLRYCLPGATALWPPPLDIPRLQHVKPQLAMPDLTEFRAGSRRLPRRFACACCLMKSRIASIRVVFAGTPATGPASGRYPGAAALVILPRTRFSETEPRARPASVRYGPTSPCS